jgi:hypothetical protein
MEVLPMNFTNRAVRTANPEWALPCWRKVVLENNRSFVQPRMPFGEGGGGV